MEEGLIRFEQEQKQWKAWVIRVKSEFGEDAVNSQQFQKDYLSHLEKLEIKFRPNANKYEQLELNLLRATRRAIEKQLYPRLLFRLAYRLFRSREMNKASKVYNIQSELNYDYLTSALAKKGFTGLEKQLLLHINANQPEFRLPVSFQINEDSEMKYELRFSKGISDMYEVHDIKATLKGNSQGQNLSVLYSSIPDAELTMKQVYNLLSGRAIEKPDGWVMVDINDRDAEGNLRTKMFNEAYGFKAEKLLEQSGIKGISDLLFKNEILQKLRDGDAVNVQIGKEFKEIEANPLHNCLEKPAEVLAKRLAEFESAKEVKSQSEDVKVSTSMKVRVA